MCCAATAAAQSQIAYNSCRNRHCPKCQASAAQRWLEARQADLLPVEYYHVVFTLPAPDQPTSPTTTRRVIYGLLFDIAAETLRTIAADPEAPGRAHRRHAGAAHLGLGADASSRTCTASFPAAGFAPDGERWVACKPGFFLPVRVLSRLFRRRFLEELAARPSRRPAAVLRRARARWPTPQAFADWLAPLRQCEWVVYAKRPFAGPEAVLAYLSRYTHRVAISNSRLVALDERGVTFRWKDYRAKGRTRYKTMTLERRRVHAPLPAARAARRLSPHPPLRAARQLRPQKTYRYGTRATAHVVSTRGSRQPQGSPHRERPPATDLHLPTLRCADDRHRNVRARAEHPRSAIVAKFIMSTSDSTVSAGGTTSSRRKALDEPRTGADGVDVQVFEAAAALSSGFTFQGSSASRSAAVVASGSRS